MKKLALAALLVAPALALAGPGPGHHGPPPLDEVVEERADELGIAPETVEAIRDIADREAFEPLRADVRAAHDALREAMNAADRSAALAASARLSEAEQALRDAHLQTALEVRELLTDEQWQAIQPRGPEQRPRPEGRRKGL